ncbi:MAG: 3-oxoacyl-ACP synthase [Cyclobacteriaceae bacterium]|nr:3-oxoacyl-ACP synthase [Cyclobacteriaceae bacterium]
MTLRKILFKLCCAYADERVRIAYEAMQHAQQAANAEEKSSAGDKYETGRAMAHLEKEKAASQLVEANKLKEVLHKINPEVSTTKTSLGSVIFTDKGNYYLAISSGKLYADGQEFLALSPASPLGAQLINRAPGDKVIFQKKTFSIISII